MTVNKTLEYSGRVRVRRFRIPLLSADYRSGESVYVVYGSRDDSSFADIIRSRAPPVKGTAITFPEGRLLTSYTGASSDLGKVRRHAVRHAAGLLDGIRKEYGWQWGYSDSPILGLPIPFISGLSPYLWFKFHYLRNKIFG